MNEFNLIDEFNKFIKKWCGNSYPHLIDTDENDGERFRSLLREALQKERERIIKEIKEEFNGLDNVSRVIDFIKRI